MAALKQLKKWLGKERIGEDTMKQKSIKSWLIGGLLAGIMPMLYAQPLELNELLNASLMGLDVVKPKQSSVFKKYGMSFASACMCDSTAMRIDGKTSTVYLYNACNTFDKQDKDNQRLHIIATEQRGDSLWIKTRSAEQDEVSFELSKRDQILYDVKVHSAQTIPMAEGFKKVYIKQKDKPKFKAAACGDFDG